jgi:hypothetical protein
MRRAGNRAALLVLATGALVLGGCSSKTSTSPTPLLRLERGDLAAVIRTLAEAAPGVKAELAATKAAWPLIANGLPAGSHALPPRAAVRAAAAAAAKLKTPALFEARAAASITGPGSQLAGEMRNSIALSTRGWQMIDFAVKQIEHGAPTAARFARSNVNLYIESVYDAHYSLSQIGKQLLAAYRKLGGTTAFGVALTQRAVDAVAGAYSEANLRLHPHVGVKLGS